MNTELYYNPDDTICAISTPPGTGGVAIARVSGKDTFTIVSRIWNGKDISRMESHTAHLGEITDTNDSTVLDQAVLTIFRAPRSFTGEDVAEISIHGSRWIQRRLIQALTAAGARLALSGEFTRRAFAAGKMDLAEAEAVADLIASSSAAAHRQAFSQMRGRFSQKIEEIRSKLLELASLLELELDFSEEDVEFASRQRLRTLSVDAAATLQKLADSFTAGAAIKDGIPVAIIGKTNVGKSSLLNAILADDRAIVSDIHGTTRDIIEDTAEIGPYLVRFKDTAGIRLSDDPVENLGIERSRRAAASAQLVLLVVDATDPLYDSTTVGQLDSGHTIIVINKTDICPASDITALTEVLPQATTIEVSALNDTGIDRLRSLIVEKLNDTLGENAGADIIVTNQRHAHAFSEAARLLRAVTDGLDTALPPDLIAQDLREAIHNLSSVTGAITTPEILQSIFTHFCVGK